MYSVFKKYLRILPFIFFLSSSIIISAQGQKMNESNKEIQLLNKSDSIQYALGTFVALWMNSQNLVMDKPALFSKGMNDVFKNSRRVIPDSMVGKMIQQYQLSTLKGVGMKVEEQLFEGLKNRKDVGMIPGGIFYLIKSKGQGVIASETDTLIFHLRARLANGMLVEDTYAKKTPYKTVFANLFPGLKEPLKMMQEGSFWTIYIPAELAYGEKGTELIPPFSPLIIDLDLIKIKKMAYQGQIHQKGRTN